MPILRLFCLFLLSATANLHNIALQTMKMMNQSKLDSQSLQRWLFLVSIFLLMGTPLSSAVETFSEKVTGAKLPKQVSFTHRGKSYTLQATGSAVRRKWFTNGYVIGHYIVDPAKGTQEVVLKDIYSDDKPKQMTILWLHRLPSKLIKDSFRESIAKILGPPATERMKDGISKFVDFFKFDAEVGDRYVIRWLPGGDIQVYYNDEKMGNLINADLAEALWSIWLGAESVVDRQDMLQFVLKG